jgi:hypothetical protein
LKELEAKWEVVSVTLVEQKNSFDPLFTSLCEPGEPYNKGATLYKFERDLRAL